MLPQTSTVELRNAQNSDNKLHPLICYLKDGTLPKDAPTSQYFLSDNEINIIPCREKNHYSIGSTENPTTGVLTLVVGPFH